MTTTTMRRLVPSELIAPLKLPGNYDWLHRTPIDTSPPSTRLDVKIPPDPALAQHGRLIARLEEAGDGQAVMLCQLFDRSKALAEGPKLLRPTPEQCVALEQVDVNVSFDDY